MKLLEMYDNRSEILAILCPRRDLNPEPSDPKVDHK
jgi:hypothetical protein